MCTLVSALCVCVCVCVCTRRLGCVCASLGRDSRVCAVCVPMWGLRSMYSCVCMYGVCMPGDSGMFAHVCVSMGTQGGVLGALSWLVPDWRRAYAWQVAEAGQGQFSFLPPRCILGRKDCNAVRAAHGVGVTVSITLPALPAAHPRWTVLNSNPYIYIFFKIYLFLLESQIYREEERQKDLRLMIYSPSGHNSWS